MKHLLVWLKRSSSFIKKAIKYGFSFLIFVTLSPITDKFVMDRGMTPGDLELARKDKLYDGLFCKLYNLSSFNIPNVRAQRRLYETEELYKQKKYCITK
jgi:hypothetical protein